MSRVAIAKTWDQAPVSRAGARILQVDVDYGLDDRLLPIDAVMQIAGLGKTTIYGLMRKGKFPMACKPGGLSSRWSEREVNEWRDNLLAARPSISPKP